MPKIQVILHKFIFQKLKKKHKQLKHFQYVHFIETYIKSKNAHRQNMINTSKVF